MKTLKYLLFFLTLPLVSNAQTVDWVLPFGSSDFDQIMKLRALGNDSFAAVGIIDSGLVSVGPLNLQNSQNAFNQASFIIKGDNNGNVAWGISFEARSNINGFEVDNAGNMYIAGNFDGSIDFDPGPGLDTLISDINAGNGDGFLAKFSPSGNLLWKQRLRNLGMDVRDIAIDGSGNVYVAGSNTGTVYTLTQGDTIARGPNSFVSGAFMAKFDAANGSFIWGHSFYPNANSFAPPEITQIEADGSGNVYVLGNTSDTIDINPTGGASFINALDFSNERMFLASYSSSASLDGRMPSN
jgi:hypothetical protein